jgi:carboxyl-terminal processing protease
VPSGRCIQAINYAEKDEDGSVKRIPDSLKTPFKTLNGRTVYDGGGIDPDITVDPDKLSPIAISLINNNHIFNYATLFKVKNPAIAASKQFSLSDNEYNNFINYLKDKEYDYTTETEESLEAFKKIAEKEKYFEAVKKDFEALSDNVKHDKEKDLIKFKDEIKALLEEEIVTRYYYSKGRTELSFKNDKDIQQALKVLNNKAEYYKILQPAEASAKDVIQK